MERMCVLSLLVIGTLFSFVIGQDIPQITKQILPEIKRIGTTGYLNCTITRQGDNKVYWIHKSSQTVISSDDKVELDNYLNKLLDGYPKYDIIKDVRDDQTTYTLLIRRLRLEDSGWYTCQVLVRGGAGGGDTASISISKDGLLTVLLPPTIRQSKTTQVVNVEEGRNVNLTCDATGYPTPNITWVRTNGKALPPPINTVSYRTKILQLKGLRRQDRGVYRCIADNNVRPPATYDATLYVDFKPHAKAVQSSYGQAANMQFHLVIECVIAGYPKPELRWYKVTKEGLDPITDDNKHVIHVLLNHGHPWLSIQAFWYQMTILNVQGNDFGDYICEGINGMGSHRAKVHVYETSECQGANCPAGQRYGTTDSAHSVLPSVTMATIAIWLTLALSWLQS